MQETETRVDGRLVRSRSTGMVAGLAAVVIARSVVRDRPEEVAGEVDLPVLVLTGTRDRFAPPAWAEHLADWSGGRDQTMPGTHNTCFTAPRPAADAVHAAVQRWSSAADSHRRRPG
jgi:pimeloyl-ACP methyl ester carboxylesterase